MIPLQKVNRNQNFLVEVESKRIYLFSACELRSAGLRSICTDESGFTIVGAQSRLTTSYEDISASRPDVIIIDTTLLAGLRPDNLEEVFQPLLQISQVAILADKLDVSLACSAIAGGANGYLLTSVSLDEFLQALRVITTGGIWLGKALTRLLVRQNVHASPADPALSPRLLSQREQQILNHVARGKTSKEIAAELYLSESSIRTYWYRIINKLNALNKAEAIARAGRLGLLDSTIEDDKEALSVVSPRLKGILHERITGAMPS